MSVLRHALGALLLVLLASCKTPTDAVARAFFITLSGSQAAALVQGVYEFGSNATQTLAVQALSVTDDLIEVTITNDIAVGMTVRYRYPRSGTLPIASQLADGVVEVTPYGGSPFTTVSGTAQVGPVTAVPTVTGRGRTQFTFSLQGTYGSSTPFSLTASVTLDNSNEPAVETGNGGGDGGGGSPPPGGGSGQTGCTNSFRVTNLNAFYSQLNTNNSGPIQATGRRIAQSNTLFANTSPSIVALVLESTERTGPEQRARYQLQLYIPGNLRTVSNLPFRDNNQIAGLEDGAVGILVAALNTVTDSHRSNRDFGRNRIMGRINITEISPRIRGTVDSLHVVGDGYPTSSQNQAYVRDVQFCIDPAIQ